MGQDHAYLLYQESIQAREVVIRRYRSALEKIARLEETHDDFKDAIEDAIGWAKDALGGVET